MGAAAGLSVQEVACKSNRNDIRRITGAYDVERLPGHSNDQSRSLDEDTVEIKALVNTEWIGICEPPMYGLFGESRITADDEVLLHSGAFP